MANIQKTITLTLKNSSGPYFDVYYSNDCTNYTQSIDGDNVYLPSVSSSVIVTVPDDTVCIKLESVPEPCDNFVISGSLTTTTTTTAPTTTTTTTTTAATTTTTTTTTAPTTTTTTTTTAGYNYYQGTECSGTNTIAIRSYATLSIGQAVNIFGTCYEVTSVGGTFGFDYTGPYADCIECGTPPTTTTTTSTTAGTTTTTTAPTTTTTTTSTIAPSCYTYDVANFSQTPGDTLYIQYLDCSVATQNIEVTYDSTSPEFCALSGSVYRTAGSNQYQINEVATSCGSTTTTTTAPTTTTTTTTTAATYFYTGSQCAGGGTIAVQSPTTLAIGSAVTIFSNCYEITEAGGTFGFVPDFYWDNCSECGGVTTTTTTTLPTTTTTTTTTQAPCYTYEVANFSQVPGDTLYMQYLDCDVVTQNLEVLYDSTSPSFCALSGSVFRTAGSNQFQVNELATSCVGPTTTTTTTAPTTTTTTTTTADPYNYYYMEGCPGTEFEGLDRIVRTTATLTTSLTPDLADATSIFGSCFFAKSTTTKAFYDACSPSDLSCLDISGYTIVSGCTTCVGTTTTTTTTTTAAPFTALTMILNTPIVPDGWTSSTSACSDGTGSPTTVYVSGIYSNWSEASAGATVYTSTDLQPNHAWFTATGVSQPKYYLVDGGSSTIYLSGTGQASMYASCPTTTTTTTTTAAPTTTTTTTTTADPYNYYYVEGCPGGAFESLDRIVKTTSTYTIGAGSSDSTSVSIFGNTWYAKSTTTKTLYDANTSCGCGVGNTCPNADCESIDTSGFTTQLGCP